MFGNIKCGPTNASSLQITLIYKGKQLMYNIIEANGGNGKVTSGQ